MQPYFTCEAQWLQIVLYMKHKEKWKRKHKPIEGNSDGTPVPTSKLIFKVIGTSNHPRGLKYAGKIANGRPTLMPHQ